MPARCRNRPNRVFVPACVGLLTVAGAALAAPAAAPPQTVLASVSSTGHQGNGYSYYSSLSRNGRFVVFNSDADNLVPGDTNRRRDVFVHDLKTSKTRRVSLSWTGKQANHNSGVYLQSISGSGRYVTFTSNANNLVPHHRKHTLDVFVRDLKRRKTTLVSVKSNGKQGNRFSGYSTISDDGRSVAFWSESKLVAGDKNGTADIYVRHLRTHKIERVSVGLTGGGGKAYLGSSLSGDGRFVAFASNASGLVPGDTNSAYDVFVRDLKTRVTTRVSVSSQEAQSAGHSNSAVSISADGRFVAFNSLATDLVDGDTNDLEDLFLRDRRNGTTERISVSSTGEQGYSSDPISTSAHGEFVVFGSTVRLAPGDTNFTNDVFIRDVANHTTELVSVDRTGQHAAGAFNPAISADGRFVTFWSGATDVVEGDTNRTWDVFVRGPLRP